MSIFLLLRSDSKDRRNMGVLYMREETGNKRDKPLHGSFVAAVLKDLFGIQARDGCACAGPYGHTLLHAMRAPPLPLDLPLKRVMLG